jgi:hypothetical protein
MISFGQLLGVSLRICFGIELFAGFIVFIIGLMTGFGGCKMKIGKVYHTLDGRIWSRLIDKLFKGIFVQIYYDLNGFIWDRIGERFERFFNKNRRD